MSKGISLHVGLNSVDPSHYAGWSGPLVACEADARDMESIARSRDFRTSMLLSAAATVGAVTGAVTEAAEALVAGDMFLFTYSGHGGQLVDENGDEEDDEDETWCLFDSQLIDDELLSLFGLFKPGVRILVFSDSCHSGTVTKALHVEMHSAMATMRRFDPLTGALVLPKVRAMPPDVSISTYLQNRASYDARLAAADPAAREKIAATVRLISACKDYQVSLDGTFNGLFTGKVRRVWNKGAFHGSYAAFHAAILALMPAYQVPNHLVYGSANPAFDAQTPFQI